MTQLEPGSEPENYSRDDSRIRIAESREKLSSLLFDFVRDFTFLMLIFWFGFAVLGFFHDIPSYHKYYETGLTLSGKDSGWLYWTGYYLFRVGLAFFHLGSGYYQKIDSLVQSQGVSSVVEIFVLVSPVILVSLFRAARGIRRTIGVYHDRPILLAQMLSARQYIFSILLILVSLDISLFAHLYTQYSYLVVLMLSLVLAAFMLDQRSNEPPSTAREVEERLTLIYSTLERPK